MMPEIPDEVYEAARAAYDRVVIARGSWGHRAGHHDATLAAVDAVWPLAVAEGRRQEAADIAFRIEAELVCCDVFERDKNTDRAGTHHAICFWGGAAAAIARDGARIAEGEA